MLRAGRLRDGDFEKAIVGVANGHSTMNPCNAGITAARRPRGRGGKSRRRHAQVFGFPPSPTGSAWHRGHEVSLVSREVIAPTRSRTAVKADDGRRGLRSAAATKNMPGAMIGMARIKRAGNLRLRRTSSRDSEGQKLTIVSPFEAVGALARQDVRRRFFFTASRRTPARRWAPAAASTPQNTMSSSFEALGMAPRLSSANGLARP